MSPLLVAIGFVPIVLVVAGLCLIAPLFKAYRVRMTAGLSLFVFGLAAGACLYSWYFPFDWILPNPSMRASVELSEFRVEFVQEPGNDFYFEYLEFTKSDGSRRRFIAEPDARKCRTADAYFSSAEIFFSCNMQIAYNLYYDIDHRIVYTPNQCAEGCEIDKFIFEK